MKRSVDLRFGSLAHSALAEQAHLHRDCVEDVVRIAVLHYLAELHRPERVAQHLPRFVRSGSADGERPEILALDLELEGVVWSALSLEAGRQETSLEGLIEHSVWCYLADLDSGLVTTRILERGLRR